MPMKSVLAAAAVLVLVTHGAAFAVDDAAAPRVVRAAHDVTLKLKVAKGGRVSPGGRISTRLVVKNRGRTIEPAITMSIFADTPTGTPLWTENLSLGGKRQKTKSVELDVPAGTTELIAVADCDDDENPGNNMDGAAVHDSDDHDSDDGDEDDHDDGDSGTVTPPLLSEVLAGASTYATNCASCHGVLGDGGTSGERLVGEDAHELLEAMREGEDGMPKFVDMTWQDAQNLAAFLVDPSAATAPPATTPPTTTPPTTTPPTTPPTTTPPAATPTYTGTIKAILDTSCVVCHKGTKAAAKIRLDSFSASSTSASKALTAMRNGRMPPGNPLPAATVQLFADWIAGGKPQ